MKNLIKSMGLMTMYGISAAAGYWIWEEFLEDKVREVKEKLEKRS